MLEMTSSTFCVNSVVVRLEILKLYGAGLQTRPPPPLLPWSPEAQIGFMNEFYFQILMNAHKKNTTAVLMLCATIPRDRSTVHVNLDILEMEGPAAVDCDYFFIS